MKNFKNKKESKFESPKISKLASYFQIEPQILLDSGTISSEELHHQHDDFLPQNLEPLIPPPSEHESEISGGSMSAEGDDDEDEFLMDSDEDEDEEESWEDEDKEETSDSEGLITDDLFEELHGQFLAVGLEKIHEFYEQLDQNPYYLNLDVDRFGGPPVPSSNPPHPLLSSSTTSTIRNSHDPIPEDLELTGSRKSKNSSNSQLLKNSETQTEDGDIDMNMETRARTEIQNLRQVRESINEKRRLVSKKIKDQTAENKDKPTSTNSNISDYKLLYEYEETVDAIDTAIDYKNQIICEQKLEDLSLENETENQESVAHEHELEILSRINSLSIQDLRRLLCKFFTKVVDLRYSTKQLEKTVDDLEAKQSELNTKLRHERKQVKELEAVYEDRIKHLIKESSKNSEQSWAEYFHYSKCARASRKKQQDLEMSLKELLVRHGYLGNGGDWEANQIVQLLGIDPLGLALHRVDDDGDDGQDGTTIKSKFRHNLLTDPGIIPRTRSKAPAISTNATSRDQRHQEGQGSHRNYKNTQRHTNHRPTPKNLEEDDFQDLGPSSSHRHHKKKHEDIEHRERVISPTNNNHYDKERERRGLRDREHKSHYRHKRHYPTPPGGIPNSSLEHHHYPQGPEVKLEKGKLKLFAPSPTTGPTGLNPGGGTGHSHNHHNHQYSNGIGTNGTNSRR